MKRQLPFTAAILLIGVSLASAQPANAPASAPANAPAPGRAARPPAPVRDPLAAGYVKATELLDGQVPPLEAEGNFVFARRASHTDRLTISQFSPPAPQWIWQVYPTARK